MRKVICLIMSMSGIGLAHAEPIYVPPQIIQCVLLEGELACATFDHRYIIESPPDGHSSLLNDTYQFSRAIAFGPVRKTIFVYHNAEGDEVSLQTSYAKIQPDISNANWVRQGSPKDAYFTCQDQTAQCPVAHLPF